MSLRFIKTAQKPPALLIHEVSLEDLARDPAFCLRPEAGVVSGEITD
jgi:hypothetical protein